MTTKKPGLFAILVGGWAVGSVALVMMVIIIGVVTTLDGWVLTHLWRWFITPLFGLEPITLVPAMGLSLIISFVTHHTHTEPKMDKTGAEKLGEGFVGSIIYSLIVLATGYVIHLFM